MRTTANQPEGYSVKTEQAELSIHDDVTTPSCFEANLAMLPPDGTPVIVTIRVAPRDMSAPGSRIAVIIPVLNEEETLPLVLAAIPAHKERSWPDTKFSGRSFVIRGSNVTDNTGGFSVQAESALRQGFTFIVLRVGRCIGVQRGGREDGSSQKEQGGQ